LWQKKFLPIFAFFTVGEKKLKNLAKNACVWKNYRIFVTLLEDALDLLHRVG